MDRGQDTERPRRPEDCHRPLLGENPRKLATDPVAADAVQPCQLPLKEPLRPPLHPKPHSTRIPDGPENPRRVVGEAPFVQDPDNAAVHVPAPFEWVQQLPPGLRSQRDRHGVDGEIPSG